MAATASVSQSSEPPLEPDFSCQCPNTSSSPRTSPPPNCPICLGPCTNKCFPDKCMHQFCFSCLLEWSKVKAECPLCKQPFKSIKHLVPTNNEYEEHIVRQEENSSQETLDLLFGELDEDPYLYHIPNGPPPPQRQFQFRTTFTVDPHGEWEIQQMLLSHAVPQYLLNPSRNNRYLRSRRRGLRATSVTHFRREIYQHNWWVSPSADVTGRYRECSPEFYRENPAQRNRLVPWLNRELNALLHENTRSVMHVVDIIMQNLLVHHILSRQFRNILILQFHDKTDHFIHEFYSFMRSPYDMIGYDNHIRYEHHRTVAPVVPIEVVSDDDSDVTLNLSSSGSHRFPQPRRGGNFDVIEIESTTDSDNSDVIIREPTPPPIVDLLDTDSDTPWVDEIGPSSLNVSTERSDHTYNGMTTSSTTNTSNRVDSSGEDKKKPIVLPLKVRLKNHRKPKRRATSTSSCSSSTSSSSSSTSSFSSSSSSCSSTSSDQYNRNRKKERTISPVRPPRPRLCPVKSRHRRQRPPIKHQIYTSSSCSSSSEDNEPLSKIKEVITGLNRSDKKAGIKRPPTKKRCYRDDKAAERKRAAACLGSSSTHNTNPKYNLGTVASTEAGPSTEGSKRMRSIILKKDNSNLWFARPYRSASCETESD